MSWIRIRSIPSGSFGRGFHKKKVWSMSFIWGEALVKP